MLIVKRGSEAPLRWMNSEACRAGSAALGLVNSMTELPDWSVRDKLAIANSNLTNWSLAVAVRSTVTSVIPWGEGWPGGILAPPQAATAVHARSRTTRNAVC
jgi:hypothetical protein